MNWRAIVYYRTATGSVDVEHYFEKLRDLHELVEQGPNWNSIDRIARRCAVEGSAGEHAGQQQVTRIHHPLSAPGGGLYIQGGPGTLRRICK